MPRSPSRVIWAPRAEEDLREIWHYYTAAASPEVAGRLVRQVIDTVGRVGDMPLSGRPRDEMKPGLRSILAHPYIIFYRLGEIGVQIVRVLHERRNLAAELAKGD